MKEEIRQPGKILHNIQWKEVGTNEQRTVETFPIKSWDTPKARL